MLLNPASSSISSRCFLLLLLFLLITIDSTIAFRLLPRLSPSKPPTNFLRMSLSSCSSPPPTPTSTLTSSASTPIYIFPVVESTQTTARELLLASSPPSPFSVLAESQDLGKGTNSRIWISPPSNLYLTVVVPSYKLLPPTNTFPLSLIPLKIGTIIHSAISRFLPPTSTASLTLKWPNDVLIDGKKVAGVLIEMDRNCFLIGVGCNVGVAPAVAKEGRELGREAGKLLDYVENTDDAKDVVTKLADYITSDIHAWADNCEGTGDIVVDYFARHVEFNKKIQMRTEQGEGGRGRWVTPLNLETDGRLRVQAEGGGVEILTSDYMI